MKSQSLILSGIALLGMLPLGSANAAQLITNGDFETGGVIFGASPSGWNSTVGAAGTGQFIPGGPPGTAQAPLSGSVAYMQPVTQMFQTFTTVKLQPDTTYTVSFDAYISVGPGPASFFANISYGTGSGGTSGYGGEIATSNIMVGSTSYVASLTTTGQSYSYSFTTKSIAEGFVAGAGAFAPENTDIAIYMQPHTGFDNVIAAQLYLDNVSVTVIPEPSAALLGSLGLLALLRRRRA